MGCCPSREVANPPSPRQSAAAIVSRPSIEGTDPADAEAAIRITDPARGGTHSSPTSLRRTNVSLRPPKSWRSTSRTWTTQQLAREREIFWETQVTGSQQIWAALKLAVDMLRGENDERQPDLKGAKAVMDAAGCTCPTGRLGEGVWDEQGRLYKLPRWVLSDPVNVVEGPGVDDEDEDMPEDDDAEDDEEEAKEGVSEYYSETGIDKGKEKVPTGPNAVTLKIRLSDRATDVHVIVDKHQPVKGVVKRVQAEASISPNVKTKLAYMGQILKDNETLEAQGWKRGHVVNALVFNA